MKIDKFTKQGLRAALPSFLVILAVSMMMAALIVAYLVFRYYPLWDSKMKANKLIEEGMRSGDEIYLEKDTSNCEQPTERNCAYLSRIEDTYYLQVSTFQCWKRGNEEWDCHDQL